VLDVIAEDGLLGAARERGSQLQQGLLDAGAAQVRGRGLLLGAALPSEAATAVATAALETGFIVNDVAPDTIRLAPPLIVSEDECQALLLAWPNIVATASEADRA
jgi:acetylornithine/N-succinyldiaminopimelate aminotransferase